MDDVEIHESGEDYLETILMLENRMGYVRAIDIATEMGYAKPTISIAMRRLRENGYIDVDQRRDIHLTALGREVAERIYERHQLLSSWLTALGVDPQTASEDACKMEHVISRESFEAIKKHMGGF